MPLQDNDNLIVGRGDTSYKITYEDLKEKLEEDGVGPPPVDPVVIKKPTVLSPANGAGIGGDTTYYPETSAITAVEDTQPIVGIAQDSLLAAYEAGEIEFDAQAQINAQITVKNQLDAAGVTAITGFWLGYPGSTHAAYGVRAYSAYLMRFDLTGNGWSAAAGDIRDRTTLDRVVGEAYYSNDYAFEPWWNKTPDKNPQGQPPGGAAMTGSAVPGEVYGSFFSNPITRTIGSDADLDFRVGTYIDANLATDVEKVNSAAAIGIYDQDENLVVLFGYDAGNINTVLTLTDNKAFNSDTGDEVTTIDQVFKAGDKVVGNGDATVFADSPAFSTTLYPGNEVGQPISTGINNEGKSLVWIKARTKATSHYLQTTGIDDGYLVTNWTNGVQPNQDLTFESDGFTIKTNTTGFTNSIEAGNPIEYVAWNFRGAPGFFDIVTYDGDSNPNTVVPHSLNAEPGFIILKRTTSAASWICYHKELGSSKALTLDTPNEAFDDANSFTADPTSTGFNPGGDIGYANELGGSYVAYLFADTPGLIKCGAESGAPATVNCGFKPGWVLLKRSSGVSSWHIFDNKRGNMALYPDVTSPDAGPQDFTFTDTGFTQNVMSGDFIYVAIKEDPSAGQFMPTGVLTEDADASGPSMTLTDVTGEWKPGLTAVNETEVTESAPGADDIVFTSNKPATTSGTVNSWGAAEWELSVDSGFADKQTASVQLQNIDVEQGPTSFTLEADTEYWVHTRYSSSDPAAGPSEWSDANKFKTAGGTGAPGWFNVLNVPTGAYRGFAYGNGKYVALNGDGSNQPIIHSNDGITWSADNVTGTELSIWKSLAFGANMFVAVASYASSGKQLMYSSDGLNWTTSSVLGNGQFAQVRFLNNEFWITSGAANQVYKSSNGIDWQLVTFPSSAGIKNIAYGNNMYVGVDSSIPSKVHTSPDGVAWTERQVGLDNENFQDIAFGNGMFFVPANNKPNSYYSADGISWDNSELQGLATEGWTSVTYGDDKFVAVSVTGTNRIAYSEDAKSWTMTAAPTENPVSWNNVSYANDKFIAGGNNAIIYSFTGTGDPVRSLFYDENAGRAVNDIELERRYGVDPLETDLRKFGIYPLTEQPTYSVDTFVKEGQAYNPVRDFTGDLNRANSTIEELRSRLSSLESDEINDDAVDTALLTLLGNLNTRITALEENN